MQAVADAWDPSTLPAEFRKKDGTPSKMRNHRGNVPTLPQNKLCPRCPAKFTRTTHLNRHLRTHTNERLHRCDMCDSQFTRSDLLTRHKKSCSDPANRNRRKSCIACTESKIRCDRQSPCSKCVSRGKECIFPSSGRHASVLSATTATPTDASSDSSTSPTTTFVPTSKTSHTVPSRPLNTKEVDQVISVDSDALSEIARDKSSIESMPALDDDSRPTEGMTSTSATATSLDATSLLPVHSHLTSAYSKDLFEAFLTDLFSPSPIIHPFSEEISWPEGINLLTSSTDDFPFATQIAYDVNLSKHPSTAASANSLLYMSSVQPAISDVRHSSPSDSIIDSTPPAELQHYLYLFQSAFLSQVPIVHATTFNSENKPPILLSAMYACGALFVKTRKAASFIGRILETAREALVAEFAKNSTDSADQIHLILAVVLLQTIGLFHQQPDQRASSSIYHGMLVMMIRRTGIITKNASWEPPSLTSFPLELIWQQWIGREMTKRAIWWSYLHDCCHTIYFALPLSYHPNEIEFNLPCEDALWQAQSASDWYMTLQSASPYGPARSRIIGTSMPFALSALLQTREITETIPLNSFSHFILVHYILRRLFDTCLQGRFPRSSGDRASLNTEAVNQELYLLQFALHNWLQNWFGSPEKSNVQGQNEEPPFICNVVPFYWLGQISLLAYQEALPPFEVNSLNNLKVEVRFRIVKHWLKHIRGFLKKGDQAATRFWDELMIIRLQTWQQELEGEPMEDQDGLLGFFPES